jgi:hypothetical protein
MKTRTKDAKKTNFMIKTALLEKMEMLIPSGKRSEFVNRALNRELMLFAREKAAKEMDAFAGKQKIKLTNKELMELKQYGRR